MSNINSVIITGFNSRDAEYRSAPSGSGVLSFAIAVNEYSKNGDVVNFIDCVLFGNRAASIAQGGGIPRGTRLAIRGHLHQSRWADKTT
ncbi:MAG: single-stranded DNA-binding protein, partial [Eggerthellaceae bacterium]|nr:single-stranded DNA-binding protein [Eggerthellaceae bacterium]